MRSAEIQSPIPIPEGQLSRRIPFQDSITTAPSLSLITENGNRHDSQERSHLVGYHIENVKSLLHLAGELKSFIIDQKLAASIQGKQYVMVEGWQFAGAMLGLCCVVDTTSLQDLSRGQEIRFRVSAHVYQVSSGKLVASASASCSNTEAGKQSFAAYAVESMAQTRSVSKAYRTYLSWLVKAAGFEATPYEEMPLTAEDMASVVMACAEQYDRLMRLTGSAFIHPTDLEEPVKTAILGKTLTERQAQEAIVALRNLIDERNF